MHLSRVMTAQVSRAFHETQFLSTFCQQKLTTIIGHLFSSPDFVGRDQFLDAEGQIPSSHRVGDFRGLSNPSQKCPQTEVSI
eukprot:m.245287 g.245287  ORF g.245287 m.245287 type:complete len:82 (-) comp15851_c0_seq2:1245-1490(-)